MDQLFLLLLWLSCLSGFMLLGLFVAWLIEKVRRL